MGLTAKGSSHPAKKSALYVERAECGGRGSHARCLPWVISGGMKAVRARFWG